MGLDVELTGVGDLIEELERKATNVSRVESEALNKAAQPILEEARRTTAFDDKSRKLRSSLKVGKTKFKLSRGLKSVYKLIGVFDENVFYAADVEFGHAPPNAKNNHTGAVTPAHPFLLPAMVHNEEKSAQIIIDTVKEALEK